MGKRRPLCHGENYRDICTTPACPVCSPWQRPDETSEQWKARIRAEYLAAPYRIEEGAA